MKGCDACLEARTPDYFLDFFFLCIFAFFLPGVVPRWFSCAFLAHTGTWVTCLSPAWESSWDAEPAGRDFSEWRPFFLLPACLEPGALFLGECSLCALSCDIVMGGGANPEHSLMCLFICWPDEVMALRQAPHMKLHCNACRQCGSGMPGSFWMVYAQNGQQDMRGLCPSLVSSDR